MEIDESDKYLATGDVNGLVKIWEIADYCLDIASQSAISIMTERNIFSIFIWFSNILKLYMIYFDLKSSSTLHNHFSQRCDQFVMLLQEVRQNLHFDSIIGL
jgi:hypothetical protein